MTSLSIPEKLIAPHPQIKALCDMEPSKLQAQATKICIKGQLIDDFNPADFSDEDDRRVLPIPMLHDEPDATGLSVRRRSSAVAIRGERGQFAKPFKDVKAVVKSLNAGQDHDYPAAVSVPTGRPKGRPKLVTV